jgi:ribosomal 50S subunit-recycling heat shock protein
MRLDLFLKTSRLVKRRGQAKALCDAGRVRIDGIPAKAARQVRVGNRITLNLFRRQLVVEVRQVHAAAGGRGRPAALYTVVAERRSAQEMVEEGEEERNADFHG